MRLPHFRVRTLMVAVGVVALLALITDYYRGHGPFATESGDIVAPSRSGEAVV